MSDFIWRPIATVALNVPEPQTAAWTPAIDFIAANRLYRIKAAGTWRLCDAGTDCGADGMEIPPRSSDPVCAGSPFGALIAKIGGGTADKSGTIIAVGRYCVYQITDATKTGPLYLGVNDKYELMTKVTGQMQVEIEIAL